MPRKPEQASGIPGFRHAYFAETVCDAVPNGTSEGERVAARTADHDEALPPGFGYVRLGHA